LERGSHSHGGHANPACQYSVGQESMQVHASHLFPAANSRGRTVNDQWQSARSGARQVASAAIVVVVESRCRPFSLTQSSSDTPIHLPSDD
jgi:hypothetical protein